ncbi:MAG: putative ABC transporter [Streblomastix strix]|uniref:Putative ABC transporter n=1 Tax=Streblomastix strix TaxID=222440 RepID=A0A5J4VDN1_9EUKA|nr:MAG: putative ABC transporter [Streblomastix strix]
MKRGNKIMIIGPVGCGKSSLLQALLGEMYCLSGKGYVKGQIAYLPQQPWVLNATVKDNIIFGNKNIEQQEIERELKKKKRKFKLELKKKKEEEERKEKISQKIMKRLKMIRKKMNKNQNEREYEEFNDEYNYNEQERDGQIQMQKYEQDEDWLIEQEKFEREKYIEIIKCCCLEPDLNVLIAGDETEVGERGITLSGGQRVRLGLARVCYSDSDIILLDDPISAVDNNVGQSIVKDCICGYLTGQSRWWEERRKKERELIEQKQRKKIEKQLKREKEQQKEQSESESENEKIEKINNTIQSNIQSHSSPSYDTQYDSTPSTSPSPTLYPSSDNQINKQKLIIMATHHTKYMHFFDYVISLDSKGNIEMEGPPSLFVDRVGEYIGNEIDQEGKDKDKEDNTQITKEKEIERQDVKQKIENKKLLHDINKEENDRKKLNDTINLGLEKNIFTLTSLGPPDSSSSLSNSTQIIRKLTSAEDTTQGHAADEAIPVHLINFVTNFFIVIVQQYLCHGQHFHCFQ